MYGMVVPISACCRLLQVELHLEQPKHAVPKKQPEQTGFRATGRTADVAVSHEPRFAAMAQLLREELAKAPATELQAQKKIVEIIDRGTNNFGWYYRRHGLQLPQRATGGATGVEAGPGAVADV